MTNNDTIWMKRALTLAKRGLGSTAPNPMVGCVIVKNNTIIGEGYHKKYGQPHAEVMAINSVSDTQALNGATAYVTLEPCAHFGQTPPCAHLLIEKKVARVVIASQDPYQKVNGKGVHLLRQAGITVDLGVCQREAQFLIRRFLRFHDKKRPYIILKWAETIDGFIAPDSLAQTWISNLASKKLVHQWRAEEAAILVGVTTALHDNPHLGVRDRHGQSPTRIVMDLHARMTQNLQLCDGTIPTIQIISKQANSHLKKVETIAVRDENVLPDLMSILYKKQITSLIVEGGANTLNYFIEEGLWDEARVFVGNTTFGKGIKAPRLNKPPNTKQPIADNQLLVFYNNV